MSQQQKLTQQQAIAVERDLAKFANTMDSLIRIPFTKQGVGADAALSVIPFAGDIAGFVLTIYAFKKAREVGVPQSKLNPVIKMAVIDAFVGVIPGIGTVFDIFIRPSRKTLEIVHGHIREQYDIQTDIHVVHPFLHESLEEKQQQSAFWRNPVVSWFWLHIPDILGLLFLILLLFVVVLGIQWVWHWDIWQNI